MAKLENIKVNSIVRGLVADSAVTVKHVKLLGDNVLEVTFVDAEGNPNHQLVFRDQEAQLEIVHQTRPFSFSADPNLFKLVSEAQRIRLGYLFDPLTAINTSSVDPLPHQITAVYQVMLNRQPLRFLLADDPGAGKTIMTGLLIKELIIRGDVAKCLIVAPGSLVEQWQDELDQKFNLNFDVLTNDAIQSSRTGNWFQEHQLCLARLDKLSRNDDLKAQLETVDWDLVVVDEAHKMSAHYFNNEVQYTKRFRLGHRITKQSLVRTTDLFPDVLKACADLRTLTNEQLEFEAFACLRDLSGQVDLRATKVVEAAHPKADFRWVTCLGSFLARVIIKDDTRRERIRAAGARMASSRFIACNEIEVTPFLEAKPAGPSRKVKVAWDDRRFLVVNLKTSNLLHDLEMELSRIVDDPEMRDALKFCLDRDDGYIAEYLNTQFKFEPITEQQPIPAPNPEAKTKTPGSENRETSAELEDSGKGSLPDNTEEDDDSSDEEDDQNNVSDDTQARDEVPTGKRNTDPDKPKADPRFETLKRHLKNRGFVLSQAGDVFTHQDGSCVQKKNNPFHCWEETDAKGELTHRYWFAPKSIYEGFEMPAELWTLIHQSPAHYQIVEPLNGAEATLTLATDIVDGVNNRWVKVYPSRYLIRAEQN
jgi:hypothetical protein